MTHSIQGSVYGIAIVDNEEATESHPPQLSELTSTAQIEAYVASLRAEAGRMAHDIASMLQRIDALQQHINSLHHIPSNKVGSD
jgi:ribosomal protein S15P/S13E